MATLLLKLAAGGVITVAAMGWLQNHLLYFPSRAPVAQLERGALSAWPSAQDFRGLVAEPAEPARATAIVFHGNAGHAGHRAFYAAALLPLGLRVILAEYPGYGPRDGTPGEAVFAADAAQTLALAQRAYGGPLIVIGESLGAAVAAAAAARQAEHVSGLVLITPWHRLEQVASHHYPWLPVRWLLNDRYDTVAELAMFRAPVLVAVAEHDHIVPPQFGAALHAALPGPKKRLLTIAAAGHNDWPDRVDATWWRDTLAFLLPR